MDNKSLRNSITSLASAIIRDKISEQQCILGMLSAKDKKDTINKITQDIKRMEAAAKILEEYEGCW